MRVLLALFLSLVLSFPVLAADVPIDPNLDPVIDTNDLGQPNPGDVANQPLKPEEIAVPGTPALSRAAVRDQIRLIEFALQARLTRAQKTAFLAELVAQGNDLTTEDRQDLLRTSEVFGNLRLLSNEKIDEQRLELSKQFTAAAQEFPEDPAAQAYVAIQGHLSEIVAEADQDRVRSQDLEAIMEWVAFVRNRAMDVPLSQEERDLVRKTVVDAFPTLTPVARQAWVGFDVTWYRLQEAILVLGPEKVAEAMAAAPARHDGPLTGEFIGTALQADAWNGLLPSATTVNPGTPGWLATPASEIW